MTGWSTNRDQLKNLLSLQSSSERHSFTTNVFYSLAGKIINVVSVPVFNIFSANYLGAALFGQFSIALVYLSFAQVLADFGLSTFITKETARHPGRGPSLFTSALCVNVVFSLFFMLIIAVFYRDANGAGFIRPLAAGLFFLTLIKTVEAVAAGRQRFDIQIIPSALRNIMLLLVVVLCLLLADDRPSLFPCFILVGWILSSLLAALIIFKWLIRTFVWPSSVFFINTLKKSWPFLLLPVLSTLYYKNGVWLLAQKLGTQDAGVFQASYALVEWILAIPAILAGILLPIASVTFISDREEFQRKIRIFMNFIIKWSPLFCVLGFFLSKIILANYSADYTASYFLGLVASMMIVPLSINYFLGVLLIASEQKNRAIAALACAGLINLSLNVMFIPRFGHMAAILSLICCEWLCLAIQFQGLRKLLPKAVFAELTRHIVIYTMIVPLALFALWLKVHWTLAAALASGYLLYNRRALISIFEFKTLGLAAK
jgi:O-antigen/teichoic acid export membrane protein